MRPVTFKNRDRVVAANLHLPLPFDDGKKFPAMICVHSAGASREQAAHDYGAKLTTLGYVTLVFDATSQGAVPEASGVEDPAARIENVRCAIDYLVTMQFVDDTRIAVVGLGSGASFAVGAAMSDYRISALAVVAPVNVGRIQREGDLSPDAAIRRLREIAAQRTAEARGADPKIVGLMPVSEPAGGSAQSLGLVEAVGSGPGQGDDATPVMSNLRLAELGSIFIFDAVHLTDKLLIQPLQVIMGDLNDPFGSYRDGFELFDKARSEKKSLQVLDECGHNDFYNKPEIIDAVVSKVGDFLKDNL